MEHTILHLLMQRDEDAIPKMEETYGAYCTRIARNILDDPNDAEEILSDTWLRVWNAIPPENPASLKLYIGRITRNLSFDRFRNQSRKIRYNGELPLALEELSECIGTACTPETALEAKELQQAVSRFLGTLSKRDRQIFLLRYYYVETAEEISKRFSIRPPLVRTVLSRTRKKLKVYLQKEGFLNE